MSSCHVKKGYEALEIYNYFEAKKQFEKGIKRNTSPSAYGLSVIYFRNDNPFHDLDSAYHYSLLSIESFEDVDLKKQTKWEEENGFTLKKAKDHRKNISTYFFQEAIDSNSVMAFKHFIAKHPWSPYKDSAIFLRDELAFNNALEIGTSDSYKKYLKQYTESHRTEDAKSLLYEAQFNETITPSSVQSYVEFINEYPENPFVSESQRRIYQLTTKENTIQEYNNFISSYPNSPFINDAWKNLYRLSIADYTKENIQLFKEKYPEFPFPNMIENDLNLVGKELYLFKKDGQYGFMSREGEIMIEAEYSFASNFRNGLAVVVCDNKYGYIDKSGELVIDCVFDEAQDFDQGRAIVEKNGYLGLIDPIGDFVLNAEYYDIGALREGLFYAESDSGFQYYTLDGSIAFNTVFDEAFAFENGLAKVKKSGETGFIRKDGSYLVSSTKGDLRQFSDTLFVLKLRDSSTLVGPSGSLNNKYFDRIGVLKENRAIVSKGREYGYIDKNGKIVIDVDRNEFPNYFQFAQFENGHAKVYRQERFALMDSLGKNVLPAIFKGIGSYGDLIPVTKGDGWGYADPKVQLQIDYQFDYAYSFENGVAIVELDGFVGLINTKGEEITAIEYEELNRIANGYFIYTAQRRQGLMNSIGNLVFDQTYQRITKMNEGLLRLEDQNSIAYFDITKSELITLKD